MQKILKKALIKEDPKNKEFLHCKCRSKYIQTLQKLHDETTQQNSLIPEGKNFLISSEGAFKYFGKAYDINTGYIWEINSENQGTPDQIQQSC